MLPSLVLVTLFSVSDTAAPSPVILTPRPATSPAKRPQGNVPFPGANVSEPVAPPVITPSQMPVGTIPAASPAAAPRYEARDQEIARLQGEAARSLAASEKRNQAAFEKANIPYSPPTPAADPIARMSALMSGDQFMIMDKGSLYRKIGTTESLPLVPANMTKGTWVYLSNGKGILTKFHVGLIKANWDPAKKAYSVAQDDWKAKEDKFLMVVAQCDNQLVPISALGGSSTPGYEPLPAGPKPTQ